MICTGTLHEFYYFQVAPMTTRRLGVAVAVLGGYLYAIGGSDGQCPLNTVERYDSRYVYAQVHLFLSYVISEKVQNDTLYWAHSGLQKNFLISELYDDLKKKYPIPSVTLYTDRKFIHSMKNSK